MIIDTHCHITDEAYLNDWFDVCQRAFQNNVGIINCSTDLESCKKGLEFIKKLKNNNFWLAVGVHPYSQNKNLQDINKKKFEEFIKVNLQNIKAIGEIGLEYFKADKNDFSRQKDLFFTQLEFAKKYDLPVSIHCRDFEDNKNEAFKDLILLLDEINLNKKGVVHCFSGDIDIATQIISRKYFLGFNGIITFKNSFLSNDVIKKIGLKHIVLETDAPYLSPNPFRGERNEPKNVIEVAKHISKILNITLEEVILQTTKNAKNLFSI